MTGRRVLVIGGGVAGSSCAIMLRRFGLSVDVVEKSEFPRDKACGCCIGPAGLSALDKLGLREQIAAVGIPTRHWLASLESRLLRLPLPEGLAVARTDLDPCLLQTARQAGANVRMNCVASFPGGNLAIQESGQPVQVQLESIGGPSNTVSRETTVTYDMVVVASGLSAGGLNEAMPWTQTPRGPFGISFRCEIRDLQSETIYMACDEDGYVGLVRLRDGTVDVAAALRSGKAFAESGTPLQRVQRIIRHSVFDFDDRLTPEAIHTTPPLRRSRLAGKGRVIAIGDAAGYVEPFTGEGMTWAMQSGIRAAELIAELQKDDSLGSDSLGSRWVAELPKLLGRKKRVCSWVTTALTVPAVRRIASGTLSRFPSAAQPLLSHLSRD